MNRSNSTDWLSFTHIEHHTGQPPPQALRFSHRRGERETRVTGDEPQGTMGRVQTSRPFSPSRLPLRAHFHREREASAGYALGGCTKEWNRIYLICDGPLSRSARRSFVPLLKSCPNHLYFNMCERGLVRVLA